MRECRDILMLNWKTSLLMKVYSHCWLRTPLQRVQCIFIILWKYSNKHCTGAASLINFSTPCVALNWGWHLFRGGAYLSKYGILKADIKDKIYVLINIYAPNKEKDLLTFFNKLIAILQKENLESEDIIIGGDFNCPLNLVFDKKGGLLVQRKSVIFCVEGLQSQLDLVDIWRIKNLETKSFTWSQKSPRIFCHLAYWLISNNLNDLVQSTDIIPTIRTDHDAI